MLRSKLLWGAPGRLLLCKIMCGTGIVGAHQGTGDGPAPPGRVIEREPELVCLCHRQCHRGGVAVVKVSPRSAKVRCLIDAWPCYLVKVGHLIDATALQLDGLGQLHLYPLGYTHSDTTRAASRKKFHRVRTGLRMPAMPWPWPSAPLPFPGCRGRWSKRGNSSMLSSRRSTVAEKLNNYREMIKA